MVRSKRPRLRLIGAAHRKSEREPVAIPAICVLGDREEEEVLVTDLDVNGCCMYTSAVGVTKAEPITIRLPHCEPIVGKLKWNKAGSIGVRFDAPLTEDLLQRLRDQAAGENVVVIRN